MPLNKTHILITLIVFSACSTAGEGEPQSEDACLGAGCGGAVGTPRDAGPVGPARGEAGGGCYPNGTCNTGLMCRADFCLAMEAGSEGGPCYGNDTCNAGLDCVDALCVSARPDAGVPAGPCEAGTTEQEACGRCGQRQRSCGADGTWGAFSACALEGECEAGAEEDCGEGGRRRCSVACQWGQCDETPPAGECEPGADEACGSGCAVGTRSCGPDRQFGECVPAIAADCEPGDLREEACGRCGLQRTVCGDDCLWGEAGACEDQGACSPGEREACAAGCGDGARTCTDACQWGPCDGGGNGECQPGDEESRACGACGMQRRTCGAACEWSAAFGACEGEGVCTAGDREVLDCGRCGQNERTCGATCEWGAPTPCHDEGECTPGEERRVACGACGTRVERCSNACGWEGVGECGGAGECRPGETRACAGDCGGAGQQTCSDQCGWGSCVGGGLSVNWRPLPPILDLEAIPPHLSAAANGEIHLFGGTHYLRHVAYSIAGNRWRRLADLPMSVAEGAAETVNGSIYAFGDGAFGAAAALRWDPDSDTWAQLANNPAPRRLPFSGVVGDRVILAGGFDSSTEVTNIYDAGDNAWSGQADLLPGGGVGSSAVWGGRLYVFDGNNRQNQTAAYDPAANNWTPLAQMPVSQYGATAHTYGDVILVVGGQSGNRRLDTISIYSPASDTWCDGPPLPIPMSFHSAQLVGGKLYVFGGYGANDFVQGDSWEGTFE